MEQQTADALAGLGAATLGESGARRLPPRIRPAWRGARLAAPAYPVGCTPGDNLAVHVAVTRAAAGSVLVVDVGDVHDRGYWGEVLTTAAQARHLAGLVIDGGVRDVDALERLGFPVFCHGIVLAGATKHARGTAGVTTEVAGVTVAPGDWVVGDVDGVVVVPGAALDDVIAAGRAREAAERGYFEALRAGSTTVELLGLDAVARSIRTATPASAGVGRAPARRHRLAGGRCRLVRQRHLTYTRGAPGTSVVGVVDRPGALDADGEAEAVDRGVVRDRPQAVDHVRRDVDQVALGDDPVLVADGHVPRPRST